MKRLCRIIGQKLLKIAKKTLPALALILVWDILLIIGVISLAIEYIPGTGAKILFGALEFISFFSLLILIGFSMYIVQTNQALVELKKQIRTVIDEVANTDERMVLRYRYIHNLTWEQIGDELHADRTTVYRWHNSAINHVTMPENPIKI